MSFSKTELDIAYELVFNYPLKPGESAGISVRESNRKSEDARREFRAPTATDAVGRKPAHGQLREIIFDGILIVQGYIAGAIHSDDGELVIESSGEVDGDISVSSATIHGSVRGNIRATRCVELGGTARVIGDIETAELRIRSSAVFKGECKFPTESLSVATGSDSSAVDESEELAFAVGE